MKIVTVVGARPQFIKAAVVSQAFREIAPHQIQEVLVHTGQHYDMELSEVFFHQLGIPLPAVNLGIGSATAAAQTGRMLESLERVMIDECPDWVLVYGDTNSTLAAALAACQLHIPVIHVEAGLRSFNRRMPEEMNRVLTDHVATLLFCPTETACRNLRQEGIVDGVYQIGDVMYDCILRFAPIAEKASDVLERFQLRSGNYFLATIHRAENTAEPSRLQALLDALRQINDRLAPVVWPVHPRTRSAMVTHQLNCSDSIRTTPPLPYFDLQRLMAHARCVLTDSGGMQKEAYFHQVPCLTLRDETEWVETIECGCNQIVGTDTERIIEQAAKARFCMKNVARKLYGDGKAAEEIVNTILML
jgi:UDP-N-acetylglucosamine 2-epimerase